MMTRDEEMRLRLYAVCGLLAVLLAYGCCSPEYKSLPTAAEVQPAAIPDANEVRTFIRVRTVTHDGHKWVLTAYLGHNAQLLHHPDCPCHKAGP